MQPVTRTFIVKNHCLNILADVWTEWHTDASDDNLVLAEMIHEEITDRQMDGIINMLPDESDVLAWVNLLLGFQVVHREMRYEDDQYLAQSRSHLLDALVALAQGEIEDALAEATKSHERLQLILHRKRGGGARHNMQLTIAGRTMIESLSIHVSGIIAKLDKARGVKAW